MTESFRTKTEVRLAEITVMDEFDVKCAQCKSFEGISRRRKSCGMTGFQSDD